MTKDVSERLGKMETTIVEEFHKWTPPLEHTPKHIDCPACAESNRQWEIEKAQLAATQAAAAEEKRKSAPPVTLGTIVLGVFIANVLSAIVLGLAWGLISAAMK